MSIRTLRPIVSSLLITLVALLATGLVAVFAPAPARAADYSYDPYSNVQSVPVIDRTVSDGRFCADVYNSTGSRRLMAFDIDGGSVSDGHMTSMPAGKWKHLCSYGKLNSNRSSVHLRFKVAPYEYRAAGSWRPKFASWYAPTGKNGTFTTCSHNPLKRPAILNAYYGAKNAYTYYIKPGYYACVKLPFKKVGEHHVISVSWNRGKTQFMVAKAAVYRFGWATSSHR